VIRIQGPSHERLDPTLASLSATRRDLLVALKKRGEASAVDLAAVLGITVSAVRQHVAGLAAAGFVVYRPVKAGPGRPRHLYRLSAGAEGLFPKYYSEFTNELLSYVEDEDPEAVERVFDRRRRRRVENATARLAGKRLPDKVAELARILDEDGSGARASGRTRNWCGHDDKGGPTSSSSRQSASIRVSAPCSCRLVCGCPYQERVFASPFRSQAWVDCAGGGRC